MLKHVSNQWKAHIIDAVGINEFTDMYIQAFRQFIREDLFTTEVPQYKFDDVLENSILDNYISKLMVFVDLNKEDLKKLTISQQVILCRAILNDMDLSKMDLKKINYDTLDNDIEAIAKGRKTIADIVHDFIKENNIVKLTCKELGITQKELADKLGIDDGTVRKWSSDATKTPLWAQNFMSLILEHDKNIKAISAFKFFIENIAVGKTNS